MWEKVLEHARRTWPNARLATARKAHLCDYDMAGGLRCRTPIWPGDSYLDPGDSNLDCAGGFGGYRFCPRHFLPAL